MFGLAHTRRDLKKIWTTRKVELEGIEFRKHPNNIDALLEIDINVEPFYFQRSLNINAINNATRCIDRKAHLCWEIPVIDAKINELMSTLSNSGKAAERLIMTETGKTLDMLNC